MKTKRKPFIRIPHLSHIYLRVSVMTITLDDVEGNTIAFSKILLYFSFFTQVQGGNDDDLIVSSRIG